VALIACSDWSIPIHFLLLVWADFNVVPEPQKQSKTILSSFDDVLIIKSNKSGFFSVGYVGYCGSLYSQISCTRFPSRSSA